MLPDRSYSTPLDPAVALYGEPFRPQFHFTPAQHWINDPNGLVYHAGEWHLFYQYNPFGNDWGHMSWGHAVSRDLVRWEELPVAILEENGVMAFSGSAVVDALNTSGFGVGGQPPLVAIYTGHQAGRQAQRLAFSNDHGRTWKQFTGNPVLDLGRDDFRDPKVFWYAPRSLWIMVAVLATDKKVRFFASPDLRHWTTLSDFGPEGAAGGVWECPDLFPLPVEGDLPTQKWVLIVSLNAGAPAGGSGTHYFVGEFDGSRFVADPGQTESHLGGWVDYGSDFYAAVTWSDVPAADGRRVLLGWMGNWQYAEKVPTSPWRGVMTLPRVLSLRRTADGVRLVQRPVVELERLQEKPTLRFDGGTFAEGAAWLSAQEQLPLLLDVEIVFAEISPESRFALSIGTDRGETIAVEYNADGSVLVLDRSRSGETDWHEKFAARHAAPVQLLNGRCQLRLLLDSSSLEIFAQEGETTLTDLVFPTGENRSLALTSTGASAPKVERIVVTALRSAVARNGKT